MGKLSDEHLDDFMFYLDQVERFAHSKSDRDRLTLNRKEKPKGILTMLLHCVKQYAFYGTRLEHLSLSCNRCRHNEDCPVFGSDGCLDILFLFVFRHMKSAKVVNLKHLLRAERLASLGDSTRNRVLLFC